MKEHKTFAVAEVKSAESDNPSGEFEVILSAETLDRDGEIIDKGAFEPLPDSIPFHAFHDFNDPIGRAVPFYDGDVLKARGTFASTPRAQEIRTLVSEGVIGHTSVGFMAAVRKDTEDAPHVTKGELLEGSFVSVPSNREAAILMAKSFEEKAGARNSSKDSERLQTIHDLSVSNGAVCAGTAGYQPATEAPVSPAVEAGKSPASNVVEATRMMARAYLASVHTDDAQPTAHERGA
jgi:HK97 family phage prohead protease